MKFSKMMKIINKSLKSGITEINKADVMYLFGNANEGLAEELRYLGCDVQRVADLFNVKFGKNLQNKINIGNKTLYQIKALESFGKGGDTID